MPDPQLLNQAATDTAISTLTAYVRSAYGVRMPRNAAERIVFDMYRSGTLGSPKNLRKAGDRWASNNIDQPAGSGASGSGAGGSAGGSSGGGSGGGFAGPAFDSRAARAAFVEKLRSWNLSPSDLNGVVARAVNQQWSMYEFMQAIRKTKIYAQSFKGIRNLPGQSESEYLYQIRQFKTAYQDYGFKTKKVFDTNMFARILKNGIELDDFQVRVTALERIEDNADLMAAFKDELVRRGIAKNAKKISKVELAKFALGQGDKRWEAVWDMASVTAGTEAAGIDLGRKEARGIIEAIEGGGVGDAAEITQADWNEIAKSLRFTSSQLRRYGLEKSDVVLAQFGLGERFRDVETLIQNVQAEAEGSGQVQEDPFAAAREDKFTQGNPRRSGASL
jgi:hypothetical protein